MTIIRQREQAASTAGPSSSSGRAGGSGDDPLRRKRHELLQQQARLQEVQRVVEQLQQLQSKQDDTLVPFGEAAFVKASVGEATQTAFVEATSEYARLAQPTTQAQSMDGKVAVPVAVLLPALVAQQQQYERDVASSRDEVMRLAQQYFSQHLDEATAGASTATDRIDAGETGQALNEEGLPFVDLTEPIEDDDVPQGKGVVLPFEPQQNQTREERKAWMDSVLKELEQEERGGRAVAVVEAHTPFVPTFATQAEKTATRPTHTRLPSAERPLPIKSVLKHTPVPARFGASGMRKGFLNMNPSSPAAEHSSDPIDQLRFGSIDDAMSNSTSSLGSMAEHLNGDSERASRSTELTSPQAKKKKKTVRIQSPEGERRRRPGLREQLAEPLKPLPKDDEDNAMDEAQGIVELLGIEAIKGHPQYDALKKEYSTDVAPPPIPTASTTKRKLPTGPSVKKDVVERSNSAPLEPPSPSSKSPSAFKRGFLNVKPKLPSAPRTTQGISALERATNNDEALSKQRAKQGLPSSVPHARPSKAFAAKLEANKRGERAPTIDDAVEELPAKMSKVRFGEDDQGAVAVRVGTAASEASRAMTDQDINMAVMDEEDELAAMGLNVYDEELDEDQVEALGYFSDEDGADPDIGFDSDDLVDAAPHFNSDAGDIVDEDLRKEYERVKANLLRNGAMEARNLTSHDGDLDDDDDDDDDDFADGQDLSMADGDGKSSTSANVSRFRRERLHRAMMGRRAVSRELGGGGGGAGAGDASLVNAGPSMLIPALANVRFPKPNDDGSIPTAAHEIELDGVSDEDDERLENTMRARLAQRDFDDNDEQRIVTERARQPANEPPRVLASAASQAPKGDVPAKPAKKPSLFKARMQGSVHRDDD